MMKTLMTLLAFLLMATAASGQDISGFGEAQFSRTRAEYIQRNMDRESLEHQITAAEEEQDLAFSDAARDALTQDILSAEFDQLGRRDVAAQRVEAAVPSALERYLKALGKVENNLGPRRLPTFASFLAEELGQGALAIKRNEYAYLDIKVLPSHSKATTLIDGEPLKPLPPDKAQQPVRRVVTTPGQHLVVVEYVDHSPCENEVSVPAWRLGGVSCSFLDSTP